jgi:hypothetical protein
MAEGVVSLMATKSKAAEAVTEDTKVTEVTEPSTTEPSIDYTSASTIKAETLVSIRNIRPFAVTFRIEGKGYSVPAEANDWSRLTVAELKAFIKGEPDTFCFTGMDKGFGASFVIKDKAVSKMLIGVEEPDVLSLEKIKELIAIPDYETAKEELFRYTTNTINGGQLVNNIIALGKFIDIYGLWRDIVNPEIRQFAIPTLLGREYNYNAYRKSA